MKIRFIILLLILSVAMIGSASAINSTITAEQVSQYSIVPPTDYIIYEIVVDSLPIGTNQTHVLNYNGQSYLLTIGSTTSFTVYHTFDISLTEPNGNVSTVSLTHVGVQQDYKTTIQPIYFEMQSLSNPIFTVEVYAGLTPLTAAFNTAMMNFDVTTAIPFSAASGELGAVTNVFCEIMTLDEFENHVVNYDPFNGLSRLGSQVFQWTWEHVLGALYAIPVIGPQFVSILSVVGIVAGEFIFWLLWILENSPSMIAAVEVTIVMAAFIMAGKKPSPEKVANNIYKYNISVGLGFIWLLTTAVSLISTVIQVIAAIIQMLKPV